MTRTVRSAGSGVRMTSRTLPTVTPFNLTGFPGTTPSAESNRVSKGSFFRKRLARLPTMKMATMTARSPKRTTIPTRNLRPTCVSAIRQILPYNRNHAGSAWKAHRAEVVLENGLSGPRRGTEGPDELKAALVKKGHTVGHRARHDDVVSHDDRGDLQADIEVFDQLGDLLRADRIEPRGRLVVEDDLRLERNRSGQRDSLAHPPRKLGRHLLLYAGQADHLELLRHDPRDLFG